MKYLLLTSILFLALTGCQEKENDSKLQEKHDAEVATKERAKVLAEFEAQKIEEARQVKLQKEKEPSNTLTQLGIAMTNEKIVIDTNQTKKFFSDLKDKMGIEIKKHVDVNQSKKDLEKIQETMQRKMQEISKDIEESIAKTKKHIESDETQEFIQDLKAKMHKQIQKISHDIELGVEETKTASVNMAKEHIDLNKTKDLLNVWNKKIAKLVEEFDAKIADVESNTSKGN